MSTTREERARAGVERRARVRTVAARRFRTAVATAGYEVVDELVLDGSVRLVLDGPASREFATTNRSGEFALVDHSLTETHLLPRASAEGFLEALADGGRGTRALPFPENEELRDLIALRGRVPVEARRDLLDAVRSGPDSHLRRHEPRLRALLLSSVGGEERSGDLVRLAVRTLRDVDSGAPTEWVLRRGDS